MKVTDLRENECIHCETEEQANAIRKLMHEEGLKWMSGGSYLINKKNYHNICFYPKSGEHGSLEYARERNHTIFKAEQFLNQNTKTMSTVVNINPNTSEINITPKEGFEIDLENSDLKNGKVLFKEVEKKYPDRFVFPKIINVEEVILSKIYAQKLETLDALLCLRDEYNRIDGFTEGFRLGEENWGIINHDNKLVFLELYKQNSLMHFGKEETAKLFLKNFKKQLKQIKEFL